MRIAIASGKGGTGKTTLATNLAVAVSRQGRSAAYLDCDVEEPNGHLFLKPALAERTPVAIPVPRVIEQACEQCGQCGAICQYSAIVCLGQKVLVYPELCHGCGGCALACPCQAIIEVPREIGVVERGQAGPVQFVHGLLNVGEAQSPPVIKAVRAAAPDVDWLVIDAPPGTSCPVITAVLNSDFVVLVTEPTPFGLNDLILAVETVRQLELPFGVVINRADVGDGRVVDYCAAEQIPVLLEIPDDRRIAEAYSRGELVIDAVPETQAAFEQLQARLEESLLPHRTGEP
ncbi:MAG: ATP-binding protein [Phycisphaerae bacterium]|nr:ATP-binding protein [Phycisphaerae bacterium]